MRTACCCTQVACHYNPRQDIHKINREAFATRGRGATGGGGGNRIEIYFLLHNGILRGQTMGSCLRANASTIQAVLLRHASFVTRGVPFIFFLQITVRMHKNITTYFDPEYSMMLRSSTILLTQIRSYLPFFEVPLSYASPSKDAIYLSLHTSTNQTQ